MLGNLEKKIQKGVDFLYKDQLLHGEFRTYISPDDHMLEDVRYVSTTYITTFVIYSISFIKDVKAEAITKRALQFLKEEMEQTGIWRFFTVNRDVRLRSGRFESYTQIGIIPDLDDTACASYSLKHNQKKAPSNMDVFIRNRNEGGLFYTWLPDIPKRPEYTEHMPYLQPAKNDICSGVNANVLLYLGEQKNTIPIVRYLNSLIKEDKMDGSYVYFPNSWVIYYLISRAFFCGAKSLEESKAEAVNKIIAALQHEESRLTPLNTAYLLCTLFNYGYCGLELEKHIKYLLDTQLDNGAWPKERFCDGGVMRYGSEALTTAICLEAVVRYKEHMEGSSVEGSV